MKAGPLRAAQLNFTQIPAVYYDRLRHQAPALAAGYVAHEGLRAVGAPEGPPSEADFERVEARS